MYIHWNLIITLEYIADIKSYTKKAVDNLRVEVQDIIPKYAI